MKIEKNKSLPLIEFQMFNKIDIRVGIVTKALGYPEARKPAIKLWIDFGPVLGERKSSAQITKFYTPEKMLGKQVLCVLNLKPRQIGKFISEVLVLGLPDKDGDGIILVKPDMESPLGGRLH